MALVGRVVVDDICGQTAYGYPGKVAVLMARRNWTEAEPFRAIELYLRTAFGRIHGGNPDVLSLAESLGRSQGSVALKLANFASLDDSIPQKGMSNASRLDRLCWQQFFSMLVQIGVEADVEARPDNRVVGMGESPEIFDFEHQSGRDVLKSAKARIGQDFFRRMVLTSYGNKCAVTGIAKSELLVAGHIKSWASDPENRMNPQNGICLNRLHDKAFEVGLISFLDNGKIIYSTHLDNATQAKMASMSDAGEMTFPDRFRPALQFLEFHRDVTFQR